MMILRTLFPLLVIGLVTGQRDTVVYRRARQKIGASTFTQQEYINSPSYEYSSGGEVTGDGLSLVPDPFRRQPRVSPTTYRRRVVPRPRAQRTYAFEPLTPYQPTYAEPEAPYQPANAREPEAPSYQLQETPYHELGQSQRAAATAFGTKIYPTTNSDNDYSLSSSDGYSSNKAASEVVAYSADTSPPYFESGVSRRQSVSDEVYDTSVAQQQQYQEPARPLPLVAVQSNIEPARQRYDNSRARSRPSAGVSETYEASDSNQVVSRRRLETRRRQTSSDGRNTRQLERESSGSESGQRRRRTKGTRRVLARQRSRSTNSGSSEQKQPATPQIQTTGRRPERMSRRQRTRTRYRPSPNDVVASENKQPEQTSETAPKRSRTSQRSRSRSRHTSRSRSRGRPETTPSPYAKDNLFGSLRTDLKRPTSTRSKSRGQETKQRASGRSLNSRRIDIQQTDPGYSKKSFSRIRFPKKNLVPGTPKVTFRTGESKQDIARPNRLRTDIKPTRTRTDLKPEREREREREEVVPDIQSSRQETPDIIMVTHQVPAKTIFTVVEGDDTKSLFIDTFTPSLQAVSIADLKSTYIEDSPVIYANSHLTRGFGIEETLYDAIHPTRTVVDTTSVLALGSRDSELISTEYSTIYNVQTVTVRNTESLANLAINPDISQIGSLLQNVILGLLGGKLLGGGVGGLGGVNPNLLGGGVNPNLLGGPIVPQTKLITHTRSFLTTSTTVDTALIPVTFRGQEITKTLTETSSTIVMETEYSIQTVVQPGIASTPFLPLAPTLNRATRVVPTMPAYPVLPLVQQTPALTFIEHTSTSLTTIETFKTAELLITLGGKEVETTYLQPTKQVLTQITTSTETVALQPTYQSSIKDQSSLKQLGLLRAILQLNGLRA